MQVRCIKAHGTAVPGDVVDDVPDGAAVDPEYWEVIGAPAEPAGGTPAPAETPPGDADSAPATPAAFPPAASEEK